MESKLKQTNFRYEDGTTRCCIGTHFLSCFGPWLARDSSCAECGGSCPAAVEGWLPSSARLSRHWAVGPSKRDLRHDALVMQRGLQLLQWLQPVRFCPELFLVLFGLYNRLRQV